MSRRAPKDDADGLRAAAARFAKTRWRRDRQGVHVYVLRDGEDGAQLIAREETAAALFEVLGSLPEQLEEREREVRRLQDRIEDLEARAGRDAGARGGHDTAPRAGRDAAAVGRGDRGHGPATLENVPLALVAAFRPSPQTLAAAKRDPLLALAVQATKAMQPDAKELERARLNAMAYAASRGDMDAFWAASKQRSVKPPKR